MTVHIRRFLLIVMITLAAFALPARAELPAVESGSLSLADDTFALIGPEEGSLRLNLGNRSWLTFGGTEQMENGEVDYRTYLAGWGYDITDGLSVHGSYLRQDIPEWNAPVLPSGTEVDAPSAWKVAFELRQEKLRFTSLWVEYAQMDAGFYLPRSETAQQGFAWPLSSSGRNSYFMDDTSIWYLAARQQWGHGFSTFQRYAQYDERVTAAAREWSAGIGYQYKPGLYFELSYSDQDGALDDDAYRNRQVRFRTMVSF